MYVCVCVCVCVCMCVCVYVFVHMYLCMYLHINFFFKLYIKYFLSTRGLERKNNDTCCCKQLVRFTE